MANGNNQNDDSLPELEQPPSGNTRVQWYTPKGGFRSQPTETINLWPNQDGEDGGEGFGFSFGANKAQLIIDNMEDILWFVETFENAEIDNPDNMVQPTSQKTQVTSHQTRRGIHAILCLNPNTRFGRFQFGVEKARAILENLDDISWFLSKYKKQNTNQQSQGATTRRPPNTTAQPLTEENRAVLRRKIEEARAKIAGQKTS